MAFETAGSTCSMLKLDRRPVNQAGTCIVMTGCTTLQWIRGLIDRVVIAYTGMAIAVSMVREVTNGMAGGTVTLDTDAMQ